MVKSSVTSCCVDWSTDVVVSDNALSSFQAPNSLTCLNPWASNPEGTIRRNFGKYLPIYGLLKRLRTFVSALPFRYRHTR